MQIHSKCAVQRPTPTPTPTPTGTESTRRTFVRLSANERASRVTVAPVPNKAHCQIAKVGFTMTRKHVIDEAPDDPARVLEVIPT